MVDADNESKFNSFKKSYCGFLERWKLNTKVIEIQKHIKTVSSSADLGELIEKLFVDFVV